MKTAIRELAFHYFQEIRNDGTQTIEDLHYMAEKFVEDIERMLSARKDFKED